MKTKHQVPWRYRRHGSRHLAAGFRLQHHHCCCTLSATLPDETIYRRKIYDQTARAARADASSPSNLGTTYRMQLHLHHPPPRRPPNFLDTAVVFFLLHACLCLLQKYNHPLSKPLRHSKSRSFQLLSALHLLSLPCNVQWPRPNTLHFV